MDDVQDLLLRLYAAFNARDVDAALRGMHEAVVWANGMEGGVVHGRDGVRAYWTRQWTRVDPHVEPVGFARDEASRTVVRVHQVIRDLAGHVRSDRLVEHVYVVEDGCVRSMEIREPAPE
jgi:SnoaL-like protein